MNQIKKAYLTIKLHRSLIQQVKWYNICTDPMKKSILGMTIAMGWSIYSQMPRPWYVRWCLFADLVIPEELTGEDAIVPPSASMLKEISIAVDNERNRSMSA